MDWRTLLIILVKGALQVWADEVDPEGRREEAPKEAPQPRTAESPPQAEPPASPSEGWGPPTEPPPVTLIHIKTDAGATVAAASFVGDECFGVTKMERMRQPGESRRVRRKTQPPVEKAPRDPRVARLMAEASALYERQQEAIRVAVAAGATRLAEEDAPALATATRPRSRSRGDTLPTSSLSPATLMLLEIGEPTTCVLKAA